MSKSYFWNDFECGVTILSNAFSGEFLSSPVDMYRIVRLAALGQEVTCTPKGLADLWEIQPRLVGKSVESLRALVSVKGVGYVRTLSISKNLLISQRRKGSTSDISLSLKMGYRLPDGPMSLWRGRAIPAKLRNFILDRDGRNCAYCGTKDGKFHVDHIVPVMSGGTDDPDNLTVACASCNLSKSGLSASDFRKKLKAKRDEVGEQHG